MPPNEIPQPVRASLRGPANATFRMASVTSLDLDRRRLHLSMGEQTYNDFILAVGSQTNDFGTPSLAESAFALKRLADAILVRNDLLIQLIGFRNRLVVLIIWAWEYLFSERAVRLIASDTSFEPRSPVRASRTSRAYPLAGMPDGCVCNGYLERRRR